MSGDELRQPNKSIKIRLLPKKNQRDCNQLGVFQGNIVSELALSCDDKDGESLVLRENLGE